MKYFEFKSPYRALISAKDEANAVKEYKNSVCDIDEYEEELTFCEVTMEYAKKKYNSSPSESDDLIEGQFEMVSSYQNTILVDSQLV